MLDKAYVSKIMATTKAFKMGKYKSFDKAIAMMFLENSTRTKFSFELAAKRLGLHVLNFDASKSSFAKSETFVDTLHNLYFIGISAVVVRSGDNGLLERTRAQLKYPIKLVDAGEGTTSHPSQALLDYETMLDKMGTVAGKKIVIAGDIKHSRVAKSNVKLLKQFGADIHLCAPPGLDYDIDATWHSRLIDAIKGADVVMMLRMQYERHAQAGETCDLSVDFRLTSEKLEKYAPNAILMHPGPVNRDMEISSELLDSPKGVTILEQAQNGTVVRMAILQEALLC